MAYSLFMLAITLDTFNLGLMLKVTLVWVCQTFDTADIFAFLLHSLGDLAQPTLPSEHIRGLQESGIPHHHGALVIVPLLPDEGG